MELTPADIRLAGCDPYIQINRECLEFAVRENVSDIHIEPKEDRLNYRMRINGSMALWKSVPIKHSDAIIWRAKWIAGLDLSIISETQDGRATFNSLGVDIRANCLPTLYGNKLVFRLLRHNFKFSLKDSGLSPDQIAILTQAAAKKQGLILVSGPTGSGKTTTLYSLLGTVDSKQKNVCTIENPIEYRMDGITQVDVSEGALSFSESMKAMLRQDPDVILFGEIRDKESAEVATHAANTGHLVLSTLHTNSAREVIDRLLQLGIDEWTIKSTLILASAQRLLPRLCSHCSIDDEREGRLLKIVNPDGCELCRMGVTGRVPVLEIIAGDEIGKYLSKSTLELSNNGLLQEVNKLAEKGVIDHREAQSFY